MISVIICSVNPTRLQRVTRNIEETIGAEYELVVADNRGTGKGLCQVYNELAAKATGDYLCFIHEDVKMLDSGWGTLMADKASEPRTGIIGVVGCAMKTRTLSGMMQSHYGESLIFSIAEGEEPKRGSRQFSRSGLDWAPVIIVDGVLLFMRRDVWEQSRFDEDTFKGFHLYDMDISTAVSQLGYTNYICNLVGVVHYTRGNYQNGWYEDSLKYHSKWAHVLPLYVHRPSEEQVEREEDYMFFNITYHLMKRSNIAPSELWERVKSQWKRHPFFHKSYYHLYRYMVYKVGYKRLVR